jgi:hypothetical protein
VTPVVARRNPRPTVERHDSNEEEDDSWTALRRPGTDRGAIFDQIAYWLTIIGVYLLVGVLFFYSGKAKLFDDKGHAPAAIKQQFAGTFIATFPGVDAARVIIGVLEFVIFLIILLSLARGEFLPHKTKVVLLVALALSLVDYAILSFGETSSGNTKGTASLYTYFGITAVIFLLVLKLPPNRPMCWLTAHTHAPEHDASP